MMMPYNENVINDETLDIVTTRKGNVNDGNLDLLKPFEH